MKNILKNLLSTPINKIPKINPITAYFPVFPTRPFNFIEVKGALGVIICYTIFGTKSQNNKE